jgi:hypothetical protein
VFNPSIRILMFFAMALAMLPGILAFSATPEISNLQVMPRQDSYLVEINYDIHDADGDTMTVVVMLSLDDGQTWSHRCRSVEGDLLEVTSGIGKQIVWDPEVEFPHYNNQSSRIRLFASDSFQPSRINFFRVEGPEIIPLAPGAKDTIGFGQPYHLHWEGTSEIPVGLDPVTLAQMDYVPPFDDGLLGFKWRDLGDGCDPELEDCWHPRQFDPASNDSFSVFSPVQDLVFMNDGSGMGLFDQLLPNGILNFQINALDIALDEVNPNLGSIDLVVNRDPETILLNGEMDLAHPEDPEIYPYYILLNDPDQIHYPFVSGDRIPDRTYAVFKALARDDSRDMILDPTYQIGTVANVRGVRSNLTGGTYSFQTGSSDVDHEPDWPAGSGGWYADTLGFLTGPRTEFTFTMQAVDEHGRRDGTPPTITFDVGYPPCVQCVELLPSLSVPSAFPPDLECYHDDEVHPCFDGGVTEFFITGQGSTPTPGRTYLAPTGGLIYLAIEKYTLEALFQYEVPNPDWYYSIPCMVYPMAILLHGQDDPREAWSNPRMRSMGWKYQVDYDCDPYNSIRDGGGQDDYLHPTWGYNLGDNGIWISDTDGLWKLGVNVAIPQQLVSVGSTTFMTIIQYTIAGGDPVLAQTLFNICTRQLSAGLVRASVLDQTQCGYFPVRPAKYHLFDQVRPPVGELVSGTWRDCIPTFGGITASLGLQYSAMSSHPWTQGVERSFRITLQEAGGDFSCDPGRTAAGPAQSAWHEAEH